MESGRAEELIAGADACINAIGILRENRAERKTFENQHITATRNLVSACEARGVKRFIQISALGVSEDGVCEYQRSKWESEKTVRLSSLDWSILRPGMIHGVDSEFVAMAKGWTTGKAQPWFFLPYFQRMIEDKRVPLGSIALQDPIIQPVVVEDVATVAAKCLESAVSVGEVYNVVGSEEISWPEMLRFMRDHIPGSKASLEPFGVPGLVASYAAKAAKLVGLDSLLPHDDGMPLMAAQDSRAALSKLHSHLGIMPRAFRPAFESYATKL